jgi:hypothetical protein
VPTRPERGDHGRDVPTRPLRGAPDLVVDDELVAGNKPLLERERVSRRPVLAEVGQGSSSKALIAVALPSSP